MILSAKRIRVSRNNRYCDDCGSLIPAGDSLIGMYGFAHYGEQPWQLYVCLDCANSFHIVRPMETAVRQFVSSNAGVRSARYGWHLG